MIAKYQESRSCSLDRLNQELLITSCLISTDYEASVHLEMDARTMKINTARWEVYRTPVGVVFRYGEIPDLIGIGILSYSTRLLYQTLDPDLRGILVELISEGIRGVVQSQNYLLKERGYPTSQEFIENWCNFFVGSCICFSNRDRVGAQLSERSQEQLLSIKKETLFNRQKSYHIFANPDGTLFATAGFADAFHEILLALSFSQSGQVTEISGNFLRSPHKECCGGLELLPNLISENISEMTKKEIAGLVGGSCGCTHVLEMCYDLGLALSNSQVQG